MQLGKFAVRFLLSSDNLPSFKIPFTFSQSDVRIHLELVFAILPEY